MAWEHPKVIGAYPLGFHNAMDTLLGQAQDYPGERLRARLVARERETHLISREFHAMLKLVRGMPAHRWHGFAEAYAFRVGMYAWPLTGEVTLTVIASPRAELPAGIADMCE